MILSSLLYVNFSQLRERKILNPEPLNVEMLGDSFNGH